MVACNAGGCMFRPLMLVAIAFALPAEAFTAQNGMRVRPVDAQTFVVEFPSPDGETQYLCAAGDYVFRALGLSARTRIYRASPPPRKQGQGITFTLDAARKTKMGLFTQFGADKGDESISAGEARGTYCTILRLPRSR
jgi:hypothetical protein